VKMMKVILWRESQHEAFSRRVLWIRWAIRTLKTEYNCICSFIWIWIIKPLICWHFVVKSCWSALRLRLMINQVGLSNWYSCFMYEFFLGLLAIFLYILHCVLQALVYRKVGIITGLFMLFLSIHWIWNYPLTIKLDDYVFLRCINQAVIHTFGL
jgi:hypothetical protein